MNFIVIIPARYNSTRLSTKPLADIHGKPMIVHVMNRAYESGANRVIVAVDHPEVEKVVKDAGGESCMTRLDHHSGTERLVEVIEYFNFSDDQIIVNLQGDEPIISPIILRQVVKNLVTNHTDVSTVAVPINNDIEIFNKNIVKVVIDIQGYALYFSRSNIPYEYQKFSKFNNIINKNIFLRHIGIYAYLVKFIRCYVNWKPSFLEKIESLEQLRILWYGKKIHVECIKIFPGRSVDTLEDLQYVRHFLR